MAAQLRFVSPKSLQAIKAERSRAGATLPGPGPFVSGLGGPGLDFGLSNSGPFLFKIGSKYAHFKGVL